MGPVVPPYLAERGNFRAVKAHSSARYRAPLAGVAGRSGASSRACSSPDFHRPGSLEATGALLLPFHAGYV